MRRAAAVIAVASVLLAAGCAGGGSSTSTVPSTTSTGEEAGTRLTREQAQTLSRALFTNADRGGARFRIEDPLGDGRQLVMTGDIDFVRSQGRMLLQVQDADGVLTRGRQLFWTSSRVLEGDIPGLTAAMAARGRQGVRWVARPIDRRENPVDQSIAVLTRLASPKPENPLLLQQESGNVYLRSDTIAGAPVDVIRAKNVTLFLAPGVGTILRVEARIGTARDVGAIALTDHRPKRIALPARAAIVDLAAIQPLYRQLIARATG